MSQILNNLLAEHGDELITGLSSFLNIDKNQAQDLVNKGVPVVMSGLRQQHRQTEGGSNMLAEIGSALGGGELLGQLGSLFGAGGLSTNPGAMNQFLGGTTEKMAAAIAKKTGLSQSMVQQALVFLVPIVISALFKFGQQDAKAASPRTTKAQPADGQSNDLLGGLGAILDRDGDGSILDDILELAGGAGGQQKQPADTSRRSSAGGPKITRAPQTQRQSGGLASIVRAIFGGKN